jgi:hypothetical protein
MKLLFVTGGNACSCGGSGRISAGKVWADGHYVEAYYQCGCVQALEATLERRGGIVACGDPNVAILDGTVVPKPAPAYSFDIKVPAPPDAPPKEE